MLIVSGILMNIPEDLYEAARIDGASPFVMFTKITMPYVLFVTTPYLITQLVGNINNFNVIYFLTGGTPATLDYYQAGNVFLLGKKNRLRCHQQADRQAKAQYVMTCYAHALLLFQFVKDVHDAFQFLFIGKRNADFPFPLGRASHLHLRVQK